jgi:excisionase family DNA binding protein
VSQTPKANKETYLLASEAAELFQVSPKTITRWAREGKLPYARTLGGHRRYPESRIRALLDELETPSQPASKAG